MCTISASGCSPKTTDASNSSYNSPKPSASSPSSIGLNYSCSEVKLSEKMLTMGSSPALSSPQRLFLATRDTSAKCADFISTKSGNSQPSRSIRTPQFVMTTTITTGCG